jgi:hypothetical protein
MRRFILPEALVAGITRTFWSSKYKQDSKDGKVEGKPTVPRRLLDGPMFKWNVVDDVPDNSEKRRKEEQEFRIEFYKEPYRVFPGDFPPSRGLFFDTIAYGLTKAFKHEQITIDQSVTDIQIDIG